jgi:hypothetical protein
MRLIPERFTVVVLIGCVITAVAVAGEEEGAIASCGGPYANRWPTPEELATVVLPNHQEWLEDKGRKLNDTRRANLCQAFLGWANLQKANLRGADLRGADLKEADLKEADLRGGTLARANLQKVDLFAVDLRGGTLAGANLQEANLFDANLQKIILYGANLQEADLTGADLREATLDEANLLDADLYGANLQEAVYEPNPGKLPNFWTLTDPRNHLETLVFHSSPAALIALREAFKKGGMRTQERQLTYAIEHTKQLHAWDQWEKPERKQPEEWIKIVQMREIVVNLEQEEDTRSWLEKFRGKQEDTRSWLEKLLGKEDKRPWPDMLAGKIESLFSYVLFELPSAYGMAPGRALVGLVLLIVLFSFPYMVAVTARGPAGIWMVWLPERVHKAEGEVSPVRVTSAFLFSPLKMWSAGRWRRGLARGLGVLLIGLYFSLLSAFSLGWRELNVGTWIARLQPREYTLRATGWVRTVAGIQSLLSVYLLALWVLTYFGRPFE